MYYTTNSKSHDDLFSGKLPYQLTNDYLFRAVFQTRPKALEGFVKVGSMPRAYRLKDGSYHDEVQMVYRVK